MFFRHKSQLDALIQFAHILVDVWSICSRSISVNRMEIKPTVWTDISEKLKIKFTLTWCRCSNSCHNVFPGYEYINAWKSHTWIWLKTWTFSKCSIIVKWNAFEHSIKRMLDALSGHRQLRHMLGGQCLCEVARSLGNPLDIWQWWHDQSSPKL